MHMASNLSFEPIHIFALGGLCEVGKNTYCIESATSIILLDAGVRFPEEDLIGVDYVIPDYSHLKNNRNKIKALFITHGHEDHIGGIPFLIQTVHIPVIYAPPFAVGLIKRKLEESKIKENVRIIPYNADSVIDVAGEFKVTFFHVTHSIPDSYGICVDTKEGRIVSTGDFKIDLTPIGPDIELNKLAKLGDEGVTLLMADSTNAEIEGYTPSETNVVRSINDIFSTATGRLIVSTFSSNLSRIQQIIEAAIKFGRKVCVVGRSMENVVDFSRQYGFMHIPDDKIVDLEHVKFVRNNELCIICTGSQGEPMAALARIANGNHKQLSIIPGDTVVFSSSAIPGNGASINRVVNKLTRNGANVLTNTVLSEIHSSGHPAKQELRLMLKLVRPKYFMPMHGEYRMLKIHGNIAISLGIPKENVFINENGEMLNMRNQFIVKDGKVPADDVYIDGNDLSGLNANVIRDREILNDEGIIAIVLSLDLKEKKLIYKPAIHSSGFMYLENNDILKNIKNLVEETITKELNSKATLNQDTICNNIEKVVKNYVYDMTARLPMITVLINVNRG